MAPMNETEQAVVRCEVSPEGWYCTRTPGHDGPCAAWPDPVVGSGVTESGQRIPIRKSLADTLWEAAEAARSKREAEMPTEQDAIQRLFDAHLRLQDFGWKNPVYAPKDGSLLDLIEFGGTGIHRGHYEGDWPTGRWWLHSDGDLYPCRPAMARPAIERGEHKETEV